MLHYPLAKGRGRAGAGDARSVRDQCEIANWSQMRRARSLAS
mgnify:CR=1 FL=1